MLIQGTNVPIKITFEQEVENLPKIVATLWQNGKLLKQWDKENMTIAGAVAILPLDEDETRTQKKGKATLEVKGLSNAQDVMFWEEATVEIAARKDKDIDLVKQEVWT